MKLYPDCDYLNKAQDDEFAPNGECGRCYRYDLCIRAFMMDKNPIPIADLIKFKGKRVWIQTPGIPEYGRESIVEDVDADNSIVWFVDDFTCYDYDRVWEAYPIEGSLPVSYQP